jgi:hypothetical protein
MDGWRMQDILYWGYLSGLLGFRTLVSVWRYWGLDAVEFDGRGKAT